MTTADTRQTVIIPDEILEASQEFLRTLIDAAHQAGIPCRGFSVSQIQDHLKRHNGEGREFATPASNEQAFVPWFGSVDGKVIGSLNG